MAASSSSNPRRRTILVTGDVVVDHHIYIGERRSAIELDIARQQTFEYVEFGGAAMIERLLRLPPDAPKPAWDVRFGLIKDEARFAHCFATWQPYAAPRAPEGAPAYWLASEAGYGSQGIVYRDELVGDQSARSSSKASARRKTVAPGHPTPSPDASKPANILVVDDAGHGFRDREEIWPKCLADRVAPPERMVWKMAGDLRGGKLWGHVKGSLEVGLQLTLVVSAADLRRSGMDVTVGLSWERAAVDILKGLKTTTMEPLTACAHLVVSFPDAGALWINRPGEKRLKRGKRPETVVRLIYEPSGDEGVTIAPNRPKAFGYQACLTSGVVWSVASASGDLLDPLDLSDGIRRGLTARHKLFNEGHGKVMPDSPPTGFPAEAIQRATLALDPEPKRKPRFANTVIPADPPHNWTIVQQGMMAPGPFYDTACAIVRDGLETLPSVPRLQVGAYVTIERGEIEAIRRLRGRIDDYVGHSPQECPLSIAVFGAPGAGKSFIVKHLAMGLLGKGVPIIKCNLSQLSDEKDLEGAFHLVRDAVLRGTTPVVFWDEFDSQEYRWLRLLLAPMQDGEFREGQIVHPIGKCIFIFAGGTSATFEDFGRPDPGAGNDAASQGRAWRMAKGPDFKSRVHVHLDLLGPNPRLRKDLKPDNSDACFPIRRALFLRGAWKVGKSGHQQISQRLVRGLLQVPKYKHGSRSFDRVLKELARDGFPIGPDALPATEDLDHDIASSEDSRQLLAFAHGSDPWGGVNAELQADLETRLDELAARINQVYMKNPASMRNADVTFAYDNLSLFLRESNRAAVRRIPIVLRAAGLEVVRRGAPGAVALTVALRLLERRINKAAAKEHEEWRSFHEQRGWRPTKSQSDRKVPERDPPLHNLLVSWKAIEKEADRDKDRKQVRHYVEIIYDLYGDDDGPGQEARPKFAIAPIPNARRSTGRRKRR